MILTPALWILMILACVIGGFFCWLGVIVVRMLYYKGELGPPPKIIVILPEPVRERNERRALEGHSSASRWTRRTVVDANTTSDDPVTQAEIMEQYRISRLPAFVQDDCGDGSAFPKVHIADNRQPMVDIEPYSYTTFRSKPPNYMTMGLKKLDEKAWLTIDKTYFDFFAARKALLAMHPDEVIQVTPDGEEACEELLDEVVSFLTDKYPKHFDVFERDGRKYIRNRIIKEEFSLQKPYDAHPLEICARLAMEDFSILQRSEFSSQHYLVASATLFPAGWRLCERIGKSVSDLHGPVPLWKTFPDILNLSYFSRLNDKSCMERSTFFIQIPTPKAPLADYLFVQKPQDFFSGTINRLFPEYVVIRRERQTFRRLPKSNTVVFTVKTSVQRLTDLGEEERESIIKEIEAWEPDIANYKGLPLWKRVVFGYCNGGRVSVEDDDLESDIGSLTKVSEAD